ncbi:Protein of unknown function [Thermobacillus xylanilyticus]|uniref:Uncharacterized protein n=1 Tax=Thermobacillus xylanilyticus TaxID=76633 RepID=A0ABM8V361_THEXY|nr:Protein of unknown function [Thermobacillus xylanilyticus]
MKSVPYWLLTMIKALSNY